jgi:hypothetical protein
MNQIYFSKKFYIIDFLYEKILIHLDFLVAIVPLFDEQSCFFPKKTRLFREKH